MFLLPLIQVFPLIFQTSVFISILLHYMVLDESSSQTEGKDVSNAEYGP